jgi:DNA-binding transcriptional MerR regulator
VANKMTELQEWIELMKKAKELGLTIEEVKKIIDLLTKIKS